MRDQQPCGFRVTKRNFLAVLECCCHEAATNPAPLYLMAFCGSSANGSSGRHGPEQMKLKCAKLERGCWALGWNRFQWVQVLNEWVQVLNVRVDGRIRRGAERRLGQLLRRSFCCEPFPLCIARGAAHAHARHPTGAGSHARRGAQIGTVAACWRDVRMSKGPKTLPAATRAESSACLTCVESEHHIF